MALYQTLHCNVYIVKFGKFTQSSQTDMQRFVHFVRCKCLCERLTIQASRMMQFTSDLHESIIESKAEDYRDLKEMTTKELQQRAA